METTLPRLDLRGQVESCTDLPMERLRRALAESRRKGVEVWCKGRADEFTVTAWGERNGYQVEVVVRQGDEVLLRLTPSTSD